MRDLSKSATLIARIRAFEFALLRLFSEGKISGTTHTSIGQEVCAAGLFPNLDPSRDAVFSTHRCHGHFLAYGGPMRGLLAEIMGKEGGVCLGRGGSQHLCYGRFFSNGIVGGGLPIAAGYAQQLKREGNGAVSVAIAGDGALGQGVVYEALNMAAIRSVPLLVVIEHNGCAQSTDTRNTTAGNIEQRVRGFGVEFDRRAADDPLELAEHFWHVLECVRGNRPFVQILDTFRLMAHSKGDDHRETELVGAAWKADYFQSRLDAGDPVFVAAWEGAQKEVNALIEELDAAPMERLRETSALPDRSKAVFVGSADLLATESAELRGNELLNRGLHRAMAADPSVFVLGEDLLDPYGGAFKVTKGLSTAWPDRVFSTPICEAGIAGFANGMALAGGRPVVEIMFGDFSTLAMDQLINQAAKFHFMYGGQVNLALTVRLVSGGYRGYGATHSQSMEGYFCKTPGLKVVALSARHRADVLLSAVLLEEHSPVIFVENKTLYSKRPATAPPAGFRFVNSQPANPHSFPPLHFTSARPGKSASVTVVTWGGMTSIAEQALERLIMEEEIDSDYFVLTQLSPLDLSHVAQSALETGRLVTIEEGPVSYGIGAEIVAAVGREMRGRPLRSARVGALDIPIPSSSTQERDALPSEERIVEAILGLF